jgi:enolase
VASETIATIRGVRILNSHLDWTLEMTLGLADGRSGRGAAPKGETPSIYEDTDVDTTRRDADLIGDVARTLVGATLDQGGLDEILGMRRSDWGASVVFALSVAFHEATRDPAASLEPTSGPRFLFNLLNGGLHAYTNPVVSDLTEIMVMARDDDPGTAIDAYRRLLTEARTVLSSKPSRLVGGNRVHELGEPPNDAALALARELLERTHLEGSFDLALDASGGDWLDGDAYQLPVTGIRMDSDAMVDWWLGLIERHGLAWVEDPFAETDRDGWQRLHAARPATCRILGDNLTSTLPAELEAKAGLVDGVLLKPDQNGTVSGSRQFAALARERGLALITSHRSIETDSPFLVHLSREVGADAIKVGPFSDFSSVLRSNELLRTAVGSTTVESDGAPI